VLGTTDLLSWTKRSATTVHLPGPLGRRFLAQCATGGALLLLLTIFICGQNVLRACTSLLSRGADAIASYPFRKLHRRKENKASHPLDLKDFAAHVIEKFNIK